MAPGGPVRDLDGTDSTLYSRLSRLIQIADRAGEDAEWLDATADQITAMLRELAALRANARDPRRAATLAAAERLNAMLARSHRAGYSVRQAHAAAREQMGLSKQAFYRLLGWTRKARKVPKLIRARLPGVAKE
jgi:hypothetical protein